MTAVAVACCLSAVSAGLLCLAWLLYRRAFPGTFAVMALGGGVLAGVYAACAWGEVVYSAVRR